jgi:hypothetical protein
MPAAAAFLVMHGIVAVDDSDFAARLQSQRAQALLIGDARGAVHVEEFYRGAPAE